MEAVRIHAYGGPEVLSFDRDVPDPALGSGDVLVEAIATSVNPIDWKVRSGARQKDFPLALPAILGKDVSGVVRAVGDGVAGFAPGDRVLALAEETYAELVRVPAAILARLPDGLDPIDAAALPLVAMTGDQLVSVSAEARAGDTVLVGGALGSVGRAAVHSAKKLGARVIAGVRGRQTNDAEQRGADEVVAIDDEEALTRLGEVDAVADTVGGETAARLLKLVREGGRFAYASKLPDGAQDSRPGVSVTRVFAKPDAGRLLEFAEDLRNGTFALPVADRLPLREVAAAHERLERGGGGKIVLTVAKSGG